MDYILIKSRFKTGDYVEIGKDIITKKKHKITKGTVLKVIKIGKLITIENLDGEKVFVKKDFPLKEV